MTAKYNNFEYNMTDFEGRIQAYLCKDLLVTEGKNINK